MNRANVGRNEFFLMETLMMVKFRSDITPEMTLKQIREESTSAHI